MSQFQIWTTLGAQCAPTSLGHAKLMSFCIFSRVHLAHAVVGEKGCKRVKGGKGDQGKPRMTASS